MAKTNVGSGSSKPQKVYIISDKPSPKNSVPSSSKVPPPPKTKK